MSSVFFLPALLKKSFFSAYNSSRQIPEDVKEANGTIGSPRPVMPDGLLHRKDSGYSIFHATNYRRTLF